jgi:hypothetical protein
MLLCPGMCQLLNELPVQILNQCRFRLQRDWGIFVRVLVQNNLTWFSITNHISKDN